MKRQRLGFGGLLTLVLLLAACGWTAEPDPGAGEPQVAESQKIARQAMVQVYGDAYESGEAYVFTYGESDVVGGSLCDIYIVTDAFDVVGLIAVADDETVFFDQMADYGHFQAADFEAEPPSFGGEYIKTSGYEEKEA